MFGKKDGAAGVDQERQELFSRVWHEAQQARAEGQPLFACMIPVTGPAVQQAITQAKRNQQYMTPAPLLAEIEKLGWRLEHTSFVQSMESYGAALHAAPVQGHFLFRST